MASGSVLRPEVQDVRKKDGIRNMFRCACVLAGQECKGCVITYFLCTGPRNGGGRGVECAVMLILGLCVVRGAAGPQRPLWLRCWGWGTCPGQKVPSD